VRCGVVLRRESGREYEGGREGEREEERVWVWGLKFLK